MRGIYLYLNAKTISREHDFDVPTKKLARALDFKVAEDISCVPEVQNGVKWMVKAKISPDAKVIGIISLHIEECREWLLPKQSILRWRPLFYQPIP